MKKIVMASLFCAGMIIACAFVFGENTGKKLSNKSSATIVVKV